MQLCRYLHTEQEDGDNDLIPVCYTGHGNSYRKLTASAGHQFRIRELFREWSPSGCGHKCSSLDCKLFAYRQNKGRGLAFDDGSAAQLIRVHLGHRSFVQSCSFIGASTFTRLSLLVYSSLLSFNDSRSSSVQLSLNVLIPISAFRRRLPLTHKKVTRTIAS